MSFDQVSVGHGATCYSTKSYAILQALEQCTSHSLYGNFKSVTLFFNFKSVLLVLSVSLSQLILKSFPDTQSFLNFLSDSKLTDLQWIASLPGNNLVDTLAKVSSTHDSSIITHSLSLLIFSQCPFLYTSWRRGIQSGFFQHQISAVSSDELAFSCFAC